MLAKGYAISVIIPVYNSEYCVKRGIKSIINQPCFSDMELILIDDGSTDNGGKICDEFAEKYPNVKVYHNENAGVGLARNFGIKKATGKYIAFLDADDFIKADFFDAEMMNSLIKNDVDVYRFSAKVLSFDFRFNTINLTVDDYEKTRKDNEPRFGFSWGNFWQIIYRREMILENDIWFFPVKYNEDIPFAQRSFYVAKSVVSKNKLYYLQWSNAKSVMQNKQPVVFLDAHVNAYKFLEEWHAERGIATYYENSKLAIICQILPLLCCTYSYKETRRLFNEDERFFIKEKYYDECLTAEQIDILRKWVEHPKKFWLNSRIFFGTKNSVVSFLKRHPRIRGAINYIYYTTIKRVGKLTKKQRKYILEIAK